MALMFLFFAEHGVYCSFLVVAAVSFRTKSGFFSVRYPEWVYAGLKDGVRFHRGFSINSGRGIKMPPLYSDRSSSSLHQLWQDHSVDQFWKYVYVDRAFFSGGARLRATVDLQRRFHLRLRVLES